ncbi:hypothetical protein V2J09_012699 [Rumex salicifolius]
MPAIPSPPPSFLEKLMQVSINHEIINCLAKGWQMSVIIKLLGRPVAFHILKRKLCEEDHFTTLTRGHWTVFGRCLMVRNWSAYFNPSRDSIKTCDWVHFTNLPVILYDERGAILINGELVLIEYEGLGEIFFLFGRQGHLAQRCPLAPPTPKAQPDAQLVIVDREKHAGGGPLDAKQKGPEKLMVLKLDLENAYDRLWWDFVLNTMRDAGLSENGSRLMTSSSWAKQRDHAMPPSFLHLIEEYTSFVAHLHANEKEVKWVLEYEKRHEDVPHPTKFLNFMLNVSKHIDDHHLKS